MVHGLSGWVSLVIDGRLPHHLRDIKRFCMFLFCEEIDTGRKSYDNTRKKNLHIAFPLKPKSLVNTVGVNLSWNSNFAIPKCEVWVVFFCTLSFVKWWRKMSLEGGKLIHDSKMCYFFLCVYTAPNSPPSSFSFAQY